MMKKDRACLPPAESHVLRDRPAPSSPSGRARAAVQAMTQLTAPTPNNPGRAREVVKARGDPTARPLYRHHGRARSTLKAIWRVTAQSGRALCGLKAKSTMTAPTPRNTGRALGQLKAKPTVTARPFNQRRTT